MLFTSLKGKTVTSNFIRQKRPDLLIQQINHLRVIEENEFLGGLTWKPKNKKRKL